ncbi:MAG TPA: hypothetical protein VLE22_20750 [Bryobacteraceae bacterium]|nr:hypothetical protein [Bryobacteraceae bacterium]
MMRRFLWRLTAAPDLLLLALLVAIMWHEWYTIGVVGDPDVVKGYYFGSEAMIAHGGRHYASAETYAHSALISGLLFTPVLLAFIAAEARGNKMFTLVSYGILCLAVGIHWLL